MVVEVNNTGHVKLKHSGFVGLIGRPNVGKSTLINQMAQTKVAIVTDKPQTTRHTIKAVLNLNDSQIIFIDTPGFHKPKDNLGRRLNRLVKETMFDVDVILFMLDGAAKIGTGDRYIASQLQEIKTPVVMGLNKIDLLSEAEIETETNKAMDLLPNAAVVQISAAEGDGTDELLAELVGFLPEGPQLYPPDQLTDQPERVLMAEFIREKIIEATREELPYAVAVEVYEVKKRPKRDLVDVYAKIHVERSSQKGIIIGDQGKVLEKIGRSARLDIEKMLGSHIYLDLLVVVTKDWRRDDRKVEEMGY